MCSIAHAKRAMHSRLQRPGRSNAARRPVCQCQQCDRISLLTATHLTDRSVTTDSVLFNFVRARTAGHLSNRLQSEAPPCALLAQLVSTA